MKVAICMSGQLRTYKECYENLMKFIVRPLDADIFIQVWDIVGSSHKETDFIDDKVDETELRRMYSPKKLVIESQPQGASEELYGKKVPKTLIDAEPIHHKSALSMFYQIKACNDLAVSYAKENYFSYDLILRVRPDTFFMQKIPDFILKRILNNNNMLFFVDYAIDKKHQVCDKFAIGDTIGMVNYTSLWDKITDYWTDPIGNNPPYTHKVGERLLKFHMDTNHFVARPFLMNLYNLRTNGRRIGYIGDKPLRFIKYHLKYIKYYMAEVYFG